MLGLHIQYLRRLLSTPIETNMRTAVYTCLILKHLAEDELIKLLKHIKLCNAQHKICGCLVHRGNEFLHIVQGKYEDVYHLYSVVGMDERIKYGEPIFAEHDCPFVFDHTYIVSESLYQLPGAEEIPILNYSALAQLRIILGNKTLALHLFWKCMDDILIRSKLNE